MSSFENKCIDSILWALCAWVKVHFDRDVVWCAKKMFTIVFPLIAAVMFAFLSLRYPEVIPPPLAVFFTAWLFFVAAMKWDREVVREGGRLKKLILCARSDYTNINRDTSVARMERNHNLFFLAVSLVAALTIPLPPRMFFFLLAAHFACTLVSIYILCVLPLPKDILEERRARLRAK